MKNHLRYLKLKFWQLILPKAMGLIVKPPKPQDWKHSERLMGAGIERPILFPDDIIDDKYLGKFEKQATSQFDPWSCVSESLACEFQKRFNKMAELDPEVKQILTDLEFIDESGTVNISARALAVMSNTVPGRGNSQRNVVETARKLGLVPEKYCPTLPDMSQWDYFNIPKDTYARAKKLLVYFDLYHEDTQDLVGSIKYGGSQVCVSSPYNYGVGNVIQPANVYNYNHAVSFGGLKESLRKIRDSYPEFIKYFSANYRLAYPKIVYVKKKL